MLIRQLLFIGLFIGLLGLANLYVYRRFFRRLSSPFHKPGILIIGTLMTGEILMGVDLVLDIIPLTPALYLLIGSFVGTTFILLFVALIYDLTLSVSRQVPFDQERRRTIKIFFDVGILIGAMSYLFWGFVQGARKPRINEILVKIPAFPFPGFSIAQLTDVHIGRTLKGDFLQDVVHRVNAMKPNLVVITGDLCDLPAEAIRQDLQPLAAIEAPCYFVTGNHEYFHGVEPILKLLRELGVRPLTNESVRFGQGDNFFNLVGLNDLMGKRFGKQPPDVAAAFQQVDPSKPTLLLSHQPKSIALVEEQKFDLMLSGHTHGGQIFPFGLLVKMDQPYLAGLYQHAPGKQIFVSRGTGYWGPPLRVLAPSEISRILINPAT
jgi:predicted MPP superfamily phosphohydrolase